MCVFGAWEVIMLHSDAATGDRAGATALSPGSIEIPPQPGKRECCSPCRRVVPSPDVNLNPEPETLAGRGLSF